MLIKTRILLLFLFVLSIWLCFSQKTNIDNGSAEYAAADKLYTAAERLSASTVFTDEMELKQEALNKQALELFKTVIPKAVPAGNDSILFHSYLKAGLLEHYFDSLPQAFTFYLKALDLHSKLPQLEDSFFFKPTLFTGSIYYSQNAFDTALIYYKKAEAIADRYNKPLQEIERLYNRMGAMYYETGNFRLANNYFQKAITVLSPANPAYQDLLINYKMNIASILINLEEYEKAAVLFNSIVPFNMHLNEINHNLGIIYLKQKRYNDALAYFRKVNYGSSAKNIELYSNMAEAFSNISQKDSSAIYINKAIAENKLINGNKKNTAMGLLLKFMGDEKLNSNDPAVAAAFYQQAIGQFYPTYEGTNIYSVPEKFSAVFSYIQLFNTLIAKGDALDKLYTVSKDMAALEASFKAYKAAFLLADHVAGNYDSDEARAFLNKIKYTAHDKAIQNSLALYELTSKKEYLEEAYLFDQRNKASALAFALQENSMQKEAAIPAALLSQQATLRTEITRLSLKANHAADSTLAKLNSQISEDEIQLSRIQEKINSDPKYARLQPASIPSSGDIQKMLDDRTCLLSYHLSEKALLIFFINKQGFGYVKQPIDSNFFKNTQSFINSLHNLDGANRYSGTEAAATLYQILIKPLLSKIGNCGRLLIIPDDELNYIAFEALQDDEKKYLLQSFTVQYQYSTALLQLNEEKNKNSTGTLAFAPFTGTDNGNNFQTLPYSKDEVAGLKGKVFVDKEATKQHFIEHANKYDILQLATHAVANDSFPQRSFIAFSPDQKNSTDEAILYAQEIYNLRLDSTRLVILSACETGSGQLVRGEGLMSISRAFAYAGCPNIITSLWKASDRTTAFITKQLHFYLDKGYNMDKALQLAKIDLLNSNDINASLKTPNYWAQLVLIGNYERAKRSFLFFWLATGFVLLLIIYLYIRRKKSRIAAGP